MDLPGAGRAEEREIWNGAFNQIPGALVRGGFWLDGTAAGVFAVNSSNSPTGSFSRTGFRCVR